MNTSHPLNVSYLVMGLVFLGISGTWALVVSGAVDIEWTGYLVPLTLVVAGVVGLVATAARGMTRRRASYDEPAAPAGEEPGPYPVGYPATPHRDSQDAQPAEDTEDTQVLPTSENRGESR